MAKRNLYDVAAQATDEALGKGAYAQINATHPDPGVQAAIERQRKWLRYYPQHNGIRPIGYILWLGRIQIDRNRRLHRLTITRWPKPKGGTTK